MESCILSHDLGTTGDKATLFSNDGELIETAFYSYNTYYPFIGWAEQEPDEYWRAFCSTTLALFEKTRLKPVQVAVVAFSGQTMAALPVDGRGGALRNSIIWADLRSTEEAESLKERIGEDRFYEITGNRLSASYPVTKIMWLKNNEPGIYEKTFKFINAKDFVTARLTNSILTDYSEASAMALLDIRTLEWSQEILEAADISRSKLPDAVESIQVVGKVCREASQETGLLEGTPVVKGAGDGPCATAGAGVVKEGDSYIYLGTSTWMGLSTSKPYIDGKRRTHTFCHFVRGLYAPAGTMQAGGGSYQWFKNNLCESEITDADAARADVYDLLNERARNVPRGSLGVVYLPYLQGERCPYWSSKARGCFLGLSMLHTKDHLLRSVLEGVAYHMKLIGEAFQEQGANLSRIRLIGGGAKSRLWSNILAEVMGVRIARLNFIEEATSIGAAIAGGMGVGIFSSIQAADRFVKIVDEVVPETHNVELYKRYYDIFKKSYKQLEEIFSLLSPYELNKTKIDNRRESL
jgi:xylulokinase